MSETVWILDPTESRPPSKLRYHTSPDCPVPRMYTTAKAVERQWAESQGYTHCRRNGPCNSATKGLDPVQVATARRAGGGSDEVGGGSSQRPYDTHSVTGGKR